MRTHLLNAKLLNLQILNTSLRFAATDRSKVEYTLKMLKEDLQKQQDEEAKKLKLVHVTNNHITKPTIVEKVVREMKHYYHGFRLLALETKLSTKYMWRVLRGDTLSRRERQQLVRSM
uniref:LETM1 domain-containing protein n=1 Tax=Heterorhabditis bacteriophora TaxID=37862 RepID=A0A1I7XG93_HETBA